METTQNTPLPLAYEVKVGGVSVGMFPVYEKARDWFNDDKILLDAELIEIRNGVKKRINFRRGSHNFTLENSATIR